MTTIIECSGVSKTFRIPHVTNHTLRDRVLHPRQRATHRSFKALREVTFDVQKGEFFGIVGRNGSGKSTLLKTIAGIYRPDAGSVRVNGTLASFIELGVGFNADLSGHDNLFINGALLGLSRREIRRRMDEIVDFAELDGFMDMKLRNFSSGMQVRLAFSIALQSHADVLLTDEVLAVGDARFQEKCFEIFRERKLAGRTIVFVSHDMGAIEAFCDRVLVLEKGSAVGLGDTHAMARRYYQINQIPDPADEQDSRPQAEDLRDTSIRVLGAWLETVPGVAAQTISPAEQVDFRIRIATSAPESNPVVGMALQNETGDLVFVANTRDMGTVLADFAADEERVISFSIPNVLAAGRYTFNCAAWRDELDTADIGAANFIPESTFIVKSDRLSNGLIHLPITISEMSIPAEMRDGEIQE